MMNTATDTWFNQAGQQLLALCLERQGKYDDALACLPQDKTGQEQSQEELIFLGQLNAQAGEWQEAVKLWQELADSKGLSKENRRLCADSLLRAAVHLSAAQEWHQAFVCLGSAQNLLPDNPALKHLTTNMAEAQTVLLFNIGDYQGAITGWQENLQADGYQAALVHLMAIGCHGLLDSDQELSLAQRLDLIAKAHMCWISLGSDNVYWQGFYQERRSVFGEEFSEDDFIKKIAMVGSSRCETLLNELQAELATDDKESIALLEQTRLAMQAERHSINNFQEMVLGGLRMAQLIIGEKKVRALVKREGKSAAEGTDGWFLVGLADPKTRRPYIYYLNGEYQACIQSATQAKDRDQQSLLGLALEKRMEVLLQGQHIRDCRYIAGMLPKISNVTIHNRVAKLFKEMVFKRFKDFLGTRERQEAVIFLEEVLKLARGGANKSLASFAQIEELLGSTLLQRSEDRYDEGDINGFIDDYEKASRLVKESKVHEQHLKKIVRHHMTKLFNEKRFSQAIAFLEKLERRIRNNTFLKAQNAFMRGLQELSKSTSSYSDTKVGDLFRQAYNYDTSDHEIAKFYSQSISNKAIKDFNNASSYNIEGAVRTAIRELKRAHEIDGNNEHAIDNYNDLRKQALDAGMFSVL